MNEGLKTGKRLSYIDVAKGLLIIMVVYSHFELMCRVCYQIDDPVVKGMKIFEKVWSPFLMAAFFYITGFCSSFNKPIRPFLWNRFKIILFPALLINLSINLIDYVSLGSEPIWIAKTMTKSLLLSLSGEWFMPTLFVTSAIVWALLKVDKTVIRFLIALGLFGCGIVLYNSFPQIPNVWYFKHALIAVIFMLLGVSFKANDLHIGTRTRYWMAGLYLPVVAGMIAAGIAVPYFANKTGITPPQMPIFFVLAVMGIIAVLELSKRINHNAVLEYLGRNSLVIYLLHFVFYRIYLYLAMPYFGQSVLISSLLFLTIIVANIASCCLCARLLNTPYLKWILGKF